MCKVQLIDQYLCMHVTLAAAVPPLPLPGHGYNGCSVFMSPLNCIFFPHGRGMALCRRPEEEKEGQAANLELAGRE